MDRPFEVCNGRTGVCPVRFNNSSHQRGTMNEERALMPCLPPWCRRMETRATGWAQPARNFRFPTCLVKCDGGLCTCRKEEERNVEYLGEFSFWTGCKAHADRLLRSFQQPRKCGVSGVRGARCESRPADYLLNRH